MHINVVFCLITCVGLEEQDSRTREEKMRDQVLFLLESAYPNILEIDDLGKYVLQRTVTLANEYVSGQNILTSTS